MSKLLAKLTAKGQNWTGVSGGMGPEVTAADVSAAMAGVNDRIQYHLMMIRGADQWPSEDQTELILDEIKAIIRRAKKSRGGPDIPKEEMVGPLARIIWSEATVRGLHQKEIYTSLGISERWWHYHYRPVYFDVYRDIEGRFSDGVRRVIRSVYSDF